MPSVGDASWGANVSTYLIALANGSLTRVGGAFTITNTIDFGGAASNIYGLKSNFYSTRTLNPAAAGGVRLAKTDTVSWRNNANSGDLALTINGSDQLTFNGVIIENIALGAGNTALTMNAGGTAYAWTTITNAMVDAAAAIAYSKLALTGSIVNADLSASAAIAYSKLALTGSIVNADVSGSAAIAYSKLALSGSVVNADVSGSAAIAYSKLNLASSIATADLASGLLVPIGKGGTGQTTAQAAIDALLPSQSSNSGKVLGTNGTTSSWVAGLTTTLNQYNVHIGDSSNVVQSADTSLLGDVKASYLPLTYAVTSASPGVFTTAAHGQTTGAKAYVTVTQNGFTANTTYYMNVLNSTQFTLCTTLANAQAGVGITSSGTTAGTVVVGGLQLSATLAGAKTFTSPLTVTDATDTTRQIKLQASGNNTGAVTTIASNSSSSQTLTLPNVTDFLVARSSTDTLTNKTLDNTTALTIKTGNLTIQDQTTISKQIVFSAANNTSSVTTTLATGSGSNQTITFPNATTTLAGLAVAQTFTAIQSNTSQPGGMVYYTATTATRSCNGSVTREPFTAVDWNYAGFSGGIFTVPAGGAGIYLISGVLTISTSAASSASRVQMSITKNNVDQTWIISDTQGLSLGASALFTTSGCIAVSLAVSDTIELASAVVGSGSYVTVGGTTRQACLTVIKIL